MQRLLSAQVYKFVARRVERGQALSDGAFIAELLGRGGLEVPAHCRGRRGVRSAL